MKNSGVAWVGEIPKNWEVRRFKDAGSFQTGKDHKALNEGRIPVYGSSREPFAFVDRALCGKKAIAIGRKGTVDQPFVVQAGFWAVDTCMFNTALKKNFSIEYLGYWAEIIPWREISTQTALPSLTQTDANNAIVGFPSQIEQCAIAAYLDRQTALIDQRLNTLEEKKTVLAELRKATIHEVVTKGLNKNAPMKASGVAWIGSMPAHWELTRLANLFSEAADAGRDGLPILTVSIHSGISDKELDDEEMDRKVNRSEDRGLYKRVKPDDLVYNQMRAWQGAFGAAKLEGLVSPAYVVARPKQTVAPRFVEYVLRSPAAMEEIRRRSRGITEFRLRLYWDEFKNIHLALPSLAEQLAIANHLDHQTQQIDAQLATLAEQAQVLKELRKAIIHEAVTGKIDLSGIVTGKEKR